MLIRRLLLCLVLVTPAAAREPFSWIGQTVVIKHDYPITIGNQVVPTHGFHVYTVKSTSGDRLWVVAGKVEGWIPASEVVPFNRSIDLYTQEITANPGNAAAWNHRGTIWHEMKQYDKAIADHNEAIWLDPWNANAYRSRGTAWHDKKQYEKAIENYNVAIRLDPGYAPDFYLRGNAWHAKKDYDKAIADFTEAVRLDPKNPRAYSNRGVAWHAKKEYDKATADYDEAIRLDPTDADAILCQEIARNDKIESDKAIANLNKAKRDKAIANLIEAIQFVARDVDAHLYLEIPWCGKKEYDKAIAFIRSFLFDFTLGRMTNSPAWRFATCIFPKVEQDYDKAIANHNEAIQFVGRDADAHLYLEIPWCGKKDSDKAIDALIRVFLLDFELGRARSSPGWRFATCISPALERW